MNLKTYKNLKFGIEFNYPSFLQIVDNSKYAKNNSLIIGFQNHPFNLEIDYKEQLTFENYLNMPKVSEIEINKIVWDVLSEESNEPESGGRHTVYQKINNNFRYVIKINKEPPTEINQILSTFKFIESQNPEVQRKVIPALSVYDTNKLSEENKRILSNLKWPELKPFKSGDAEREVYLVNCEVTAEGFDLVGIPTSLPNSKNIAELTFKELVKNHYGGFPDTSEIVNYQKVAEVKYKHADSGVNGVVLGSDGNLEINFYDSVRAYGGGSSRVGCLMYSTYFTALQFPNVKSVTMCIDKYPDQTGSNCGMDFQP